MLRIQAHARPDHALFDLPLSQLLRLADEGDELLVWLWYLIEHLLPDGLRSKLQLEKGDLRENQDRSSGGGTHRRGATKRR